MDVGSGGNPQGSAFIVVPGAASSTDNPWVNPWAMKEFAYTAGADDAYLASGTPCIFLTPGSHSRPPKKFFTLTLWSRRSCFVC